MTGLSVNNVIDSLERHAGARIIDTAGGGRREVTFLQLRRRVAAASLRLIEAGIEPGGRIGIYAGNSIEWLVVDLACLSIGAVSVPFTSAPTGGDVFGEWGLRKLITDAAAHSGAWQIRSFCEESHQGLFPHQFADDEIVTVKFSSGTSAHPKALEARAVHFDHMAKNIGAMFPLGPEDLFLVIAPLTVWLQRFMAYMCILQGASICLARAERAIATLESERPTIVLGVPRILETLSTIHHRRLCADPNVTLKDMWGGRMKYLWTGSAPIDMRILQEYEEAGVPVYEGYGMTETGMIAKNYPGHRQIGSVGRSFPGTRIEFSAQGEIVVHSAFLPNDRYFRGNNDTFRSDGAIRTGDVGHLDADGFLYIDGRANETIVLSTGHKIFPSTIEEMLRLEPAIADCVIFGHGCQHLAALVVPAGPHVADNDIRMALIKAGEHLPPHQRVLAFSRTSGFNEENGLRTAAGKLKRSEIYSCFEMVLRSLLRSS